ncbi:peroxidase 5-like [Zingiber officinale]|uniref:peroxidase 5-like n=1 Tax=Zingiber officinale TaxID=94328 RepID=UPI001C4AB6C1|nr:peroxidase 5-like [Zingiber officinale]
MGLQIEKIWMAIMVVAICLRNGRVEAHLEVGFYSGSCPTAELIVREEVEKALTEDQGLGADLLRMFFHDCFTNGCDASILLDSTENNTAEKDAKVNLTLEGFEIIDHMKERLEAVCKGVVSCADILAFAARDSVVHYGGVHFKVAGGRRDGRVSSSADASILPSSDHNLSHLTKLFISRGLSQSDMIILSGAHTVGIAHCDAFAERLYDVHADGYEAMDEKYAAHLRQQCPPGSNNTVVLNPHSPYVFDNRYYKNLLSRQGLLVSDRTLLSTHGTMTQVKRYASNYKRFQRKFADAMFKLGEMDVLTGADGEIRANCRAIN